VQEGKKRSSSSDGDLCDLFCDNFDLRVNGFRNLEV